MNPRFLDLYSAELKYLRTLGVEFSERYPKIARRLGMHAADVEDPYTERLLEGFAFLSSRVHLKLEEEFPRFSEQFLDLLQPNALATIPSMGIVRFCPDFNDNRLWSGPKVERGTQLNTCSSSPEGTPATFKVCRESSLWPVQLTNASYVSRPLTPLDRRRSGLANTEGAFALSLELAGSRSWQSLKMDSLDVHVSAPEETAFRIFDHLIASGSGAWIEYTDQEEQTCRKALPFDSIRPLGFDDSESILPEGHLHFSAHRLVQEMLCFPQGFLFFKVSGLQSILRFAKGNTVRLMLGTSTLNDDFIKTVGKESFALYCAPAVNLFEHRCDRILLEGQHEHQIIPDRSRTLDFEVHSLLEVRHFEDNIAQSTRLPPLHGAGAEHVQERHGWILRRRPELESEQRQLRGGRSRYLGSTCWISLNRPGQNEELVRLKGQLGVKALCSNRDLPLILNFGQQRGDFHALDGLPTQTIHLLGGPTRPRSPVRSGRQVWQLIQHCGLNYLGLTGTQEACDWLKQLLSLFADPASNEQMALCESVLSVNHKPAVRPVLQGGRMSTLRGLTVQVELDPEKAQAFGLAIPSLVLARVMARSVSLNSFAELKVTAANSRFVFSSGPLTGARPLL